MHGLETIKELNKEAAQRNLAPAVPLDDGTVRTVIWSLFDEEGEFIRSYATEVCTVNTSPQYLLTRAVNAEGFNRDVVQLAELDFVIGHGCVIEVSGHEE